MYKCDYGGCHFYHSCLHVNSGIVIDFFLKKTYFHTTQMSWTFSCSILAPACETLGGTIYIKGLIQAETAVSKKHPLGKKTTKMRTE